MDSTLLTTASVKICGETAAGKKEAAVSHCGRIRDAAQRRGYRFFRFLPGFLIHSFWENRVAGKLCAKQIRVHWCHFVVRLREWSLSG